MKDPENDEVYYVYVIGTLDGDRLGAPTKVGVSSDPGKRFATIQTSCPQRIEFLHAIGMPSRLEAYGLERSFHLSQDQHRLEGEWFDIDPLKALQLLMLGHAFELCKGHLVRVETWARYGVDIADEFPFAIINRIGAA